MALKKKVLQFLTDRIQERQRSLLLNSIEGWHIYVVTKSAISDQHNRIAELWSMGRAGQVPSSPKRDLRALLRAWQQVSVVIAEKAEVVVDLVLDMDMAEIEHQTVAFKRKMEKEVSNALGCNPENIHVTKLEAGSIIVSFAIEDDASSGSALEAALELQRQAADENSPLRLQPISSKTSGVRISKMSTKSSGAMRAIRKIMHGTLSQAFMRWTQHNWEHRRMLYTCEKVLGRFRLKSAAMAFITWLDHSKNQRRMEDVCIKVLRRMHNRYIAMVFDTWHDHSRQQKRGEDICARILKHWTHRTSALAFDTW